MASTIPTYDQNFEIIDVEADAELVQRGLARKPTFSGDISSTSQHQSFSTGVAAAALYSGLTMMKNQLVDDRDEKTGYKLTKKEYTLLQKRAQSISRYGKIPYDTAEDFLLILCFVDNMIDMNKIAEAVEIEQLSDPAYLRRPMQILNISGLEKVSFAASAVDGLVNMFRKYIYTAGVINNSSSSGDDISSILSTISSLVGGLGGGSAGQTRVETGEIGNFLSELITGNRIPATVIAKNPMLQSPSYAGKAFFGEFANSMSNIDIDQLFNKKIAMFPKPSSGAGTSSFSMQNFGSFSQAMPLQNFVAKIITGSADISSQRKNKQISSVVSQINIMTGAKAEDIIEVNRADTAIPIMVAVSANLSGFSKSIFSADTFKQGWLLSQSVGNYLQNIDPGFMEAAKKLL